MDGARSMPCWPSPQEWLGVGHCQQPGAMLSSMLPRPSSHLPIARPSQDLHRAERFWVDGLGLQVLYRTGAEAEGGHALVMLGWPEAAWHCCWRHHRSVVDWSSGSHDITCCKAQIASGAVRVDHDDQQERRPNISANFYVPSCIKIECSSYRSSEIAGRWKGYGY